MELFDQIRKISFSFFISIGLAHFLAGMLYVKGYFSPMSGLINRILFIPFVVCAMAFCFSNIKYRMLENNKDQKWLDYMLIGIGIIVFVALLLVEFFVIDSPTPLLPT